MNEKLYCVYQHINKTNGKTYIGITSQKPTIRWGLKGQGYEECPYFWKAIQKYGWENFEHIILAEGLSRDEACEMEINQIKKYDSNNPDKGYNISEGGKGGSAEVMKKKWNDPSYKEYASKKMREAWEDPQKRARRSEATKKRWADEKFKESTMKKVITSCGKSVMCVETGEVFKTMHEAAVAYNLDKPNICRACKTGYRCGDYHWKYVDDVS